MRADPLGVRNGISGSSFANAPQQQVAFEDSVSYGEGEPQLSSGFNSFSEEYDAPFTDGHGVDYESNDEFGEDYLSSSAECEEQYYGPTPFDSFDSLPRISMISVEERRIFSSNMFDDEL